MSLVIFEFEVWVSLEIYLIKLIGTQDQKVFPFTGYVPSKRNTIADTKKKYTPKKNLEDNKMS